MRGRTIVVLAAVIAVAIGLAAPADAATVTESTVDPKSGERRVSCPARRVDTPSDRSVRVSLRCPGLRKARSQIKRLPRHGSLGRLGKRQDQVRYRPRSGFVGRDRFTVRRKRGQRRARVKVQVRVRPPLDPTIPTCAKGDVTTNYQTEVTFTISCTGEGLTPLKLATSPRSGSLKAIEESGDDESRTFSATYTPDDLFVGRETILIDVAGESADAYGAAVIEVQPWRMRAIGDSVTAGFGFFGDGGLMPVTDLLACKPAAVVSNRCSSNSSAGPGYSGPPAWSADFGLANDIAWPAQFANSWQGGGHITAPKMFQNRAVTGSAPSDWLGDGILADHLDAIVAQNPDLVAMTLGANPLLDNLLLTAKGEKCALSLTVAEIRACLRPFFEEVSLKQRLQDVYTELLAAPDTEVIVLQYHLAVPSLNLFSVWQLEAMIEFFNEQIDSAVAATKAALPGRKAKRLRLIEALVDPAAVDPMKLPRFDIGLPPDIHQSWTGTYDCGGGDFVDGPSNQSTPTQDELAILDPTEFCGGTPWIISADTGIHPNRAGHAQFADTLSNVLAAERLVPTLP